MNINGRTRDKVRNLKLFRKPENWLNPSNPKILQSQVRPDVFEIWNFLGNLKTGETYETENLEIRVRAGVFEI